MSEEKSYLIKVPVFTTEMVVKENDLFGETYSDLIRVVKRKIEEYDYYNCKLSIQNRNKAQQTIINNITCTEHQIEQTPSLLLKISAYTTNLLDGYYEADERLQFEREGRIGTDNNYVLIYPVITGINNYSRYFLLLVYEDPNKENSSNLIRIAKYVAKHVLSIPVKNIKPQAVLDELSNMRDIPELQVEYFGIYNSENDVDVKYREYLQDGKIKKTKAQSFKNMPFELVQDLMQETDDREDYQTKKIKFSIGKKEYRITREYRKEAEQLYNETAEKVFNLSIGITQSELDTIIYQPDFIIEKLTSVITNYLSSEEE